MRNFPDHAKGRLLWFITFGMTIWTMWKKPGGPESVRKDVPNYVRETSSAQEHGVLALTPVYPEKVGEEAV